MGGAWLFPGRFLLGWYRCLQSFLNQSTYRFRARADPIPESEIFDPGEKHVTMSHERDNRKCLEIPDPATDGRPTHGPGRSPGFFHEGGKYEREGMVGGYTGTAGASPAGVPGGGSVETETSTMDRQSKKYDGKLRQMIRMVKLAERAAKGPQATRDRVEKLLRSFLKA